MWTSQIRASCTGEGLRRQHAADAERNRQHLRVGEVVGDRAHPRSGRVPSIARSGASASTTSRSQPKPWSK